MSQLANSHRYRQFWDVLTILFLLVIALAFVPYGKLNLTYDSQDFMAASQSLETYLQGKNPDGFSYLTRAPFLPAYLHFFNNKIQAAWWLNMISLIGSVLLIFKIARSLNIQEFIIYPLVIVTTLTYPWLLNHFFLWGEPPFMFLILALTYCLIENKSLLMIIGVCIILFLIRKAGIFFFVSVSAWYFLNRDRKNALISLGIAVVVFLSWQILEHSYGSTNTFLSMLNDSTVYKRIYYADAITSWVFPMRIPLYPRLFLFVLVIGGIIFLSRHAFLNSLKNKKNQVLITIALSYMICLIGFSGASSYMDAERYLSVVLPLWMLLLASYINEVHTTGGVTAKIILVTFMVWTLYPLSRTIYHLL